MCGEIVKFKWITEKKNWFYYNAVEILLNASRKLIHLSCYEKFEENQVHREGKII